MFLRRRKKTRQGFTLIELAVVLGIIGVVSGGLWRLLAVSNQQTKDQATAEQQLAVINGVKAFMADTSSTGGNGLLTSVSSNHVITIPASCGNPPAAGICSYLPPGFNASTTNPYGQTYQISVQAGPTTPTQNYTIMVVTTGGTIIPDSDGGRISSLIGGDGGFIYSSNICGAASTTACGSLGSWSSTPSSYGLSSASGHVASQSFVSSATGNNYQWLARSKLDSNSPPTYNTMVTDLFMGLQNSTTATNINFPVAANSLPSGAVNADPYVLAAGEYNIGALHMGNAGIDGNGFRSSSYSLPQINLAENVSGTVTNLNDLIDLATNCSPQGAACPYALNITSGDLGVGNGQITAAAIYTSSDARLKTNIHPIQNSLGDLMKIDPVAFAFKSNNRQSMGVTAQNLEQVYPQLVTETGGKKYVEYNGLIGPLIGAVQELKRQNDDLRAQLQEQSARINQLEGGKSATP